MSTGIVYADRLPDHERAAILPRFRATRERTDLRVPGHRACTPRRATPYVEAGEVSAACRIGTSLCVTASPMIVLDGRSPVRGGGIDC